VELLNEEGVHLFSSHDTHEGWRYAKRPIGRYISTLWIPGNFLAEGNFLANVALVSHRPASAVHVHIPKVVTVQVVDPQHRDSARGDYVGPIPGVVRPLLDWSTETVINYTPYSVEQPVLSISV
jgi:lipopolysaccharide transport system ATP-binding protein